jgi:hypothetical protein
MILPTIRNSGTQAWYQNGEYHRDDGPAMIWPTGYQAWRLHGKYIKK